ncbi:MAG TPA: MFS transporter [Candidatus Kapabacteria bacterium]|nr:MFS transporter [Candidatus Kapabacteria bacterium]
MKAGSPDAAHPAKHDAYAALRVRDFRILLLTRLAITIASQMEVVVVRYQVYGLAHDPLPIGIAGLVEAIPALVVALFAGHIADIMERRRLVILSRSALILSAGGLLVLSFEMARLYPITGMWPIYAMIFIAGASSGFLSPASFAYNSELLPKELYANGAAWNSSTWQTGAILGPTIGGLIAGFFSISAAYAVDVVLTATAAFLVFLIPARPFVAKIREESSVQSIIAGWKFVFRNQPILGAISLDLFAVLFGGAVAMLPVYASEIFHVGAQGLGLLQAAPSVGAVLVSLLFAHYRMRGGVGKQILLTVAMFGITIILFAVTTNIYLSLALLVLYGATDSVSVIIRSTVIQILTPDAMRGRVAAINSMFIGTSNEIGAFESGLAAKLMGLVPSVIFGGVMSLITVGAVAMLSPGLRKLRGEDLNE